MAQKVSSTRTISGGGVTITQSYSPDVESVLAMEVTIAASASNQIVPLKVDISQINIAAFYASAAMTIKTNSSSTPVDTFTLAAGESLIWYDTDTNALFAGDFTDLYVTSTPGGTLKFIVGFDDLTP